MRRSRRLLITLVVVVTMTAACAGTADDPATVAGTGAAPATGDPPTTPSAFGAPTRLGAFPLDEAPGASGIAASRRQPGWLYVVDDTTGTTAVLAMREDGSDRRRLEITGLDARNAEDLAVATCGPDLEGTCLYVGDIGDNVEARDGIDVWRVPEPALGDGAGSGPLEAARATLVYPDRPHDAEALLVDGGGSPFVVTKGGKDDAPPPRVYGAAGFGDQTLADHGALDVPEPALGLARVVVGNVVTAADLGADGALVRTYDAVVHYVPPTPDAPLSTLPSWTPTEVPAPPETQGEAVAWLADRCGYVTVSEGVGDIWFVPCEPASSSQDVHTSETP